MEVEVTDDGKAASRIEARQAKVEGVIIAIDGNKVTVESERGRTVTVNVTDRTRIKLEDDFPGTLADLKVGMEVEVKFDPESKVALKIDAEEEEAEIEGVIVEVGDNEVTVETERGRRLTLVIEERTRIELEDDLRGTPADLEVGAEIEAKFDPYTRTALKIKVEEGESEAEVEGIVVEVAGNKVTIETKYGRRLTLVTSESTRIELDDDVSGTLADIQVGTEVEAKFDPRTGTAIKMELED